MLREQIRRYSTDHITCEEPKRQRVVHRHQPTTSKDQKVRAIYNQSQRRRDKADEMKSKRLATYDPKKKKHATNEWEKTCEMEQLRAEAKASQTYGIRPQGLV